MTISSFGGRATLRHGDQEWLLAPVMSASEEERRQALPSSHALTEASWALPSAGAWEEPFLRSALVDLLRSTDGPGLHAAGLSTQELRDDLLREIALGRVLVIVRQLPPLEVAPSLAKRPAPPPPLLDDAVAASWIDVQIVDEDGTPYSGPVELVLPDGQLRTVTSDRKGRVKLTTETPGTFKLTLPGLDAQAWHPKS